LDCDARNRIFIFILSQNVENRFSFLMKGMVLKYVWNLKVLKRFRYMPSDERVLSSWLKKTVGFIFFTLYVTVKAFISLKFCQQFSNFLIKVKLLLENKSILRAICSFLLIRTYNNAHSKIWGKKNFWHNFRKLRNKKKSCILH
jgi:hypothetical protein